MAACTFFGHRDCPESIKSKLREVLVDLITNHNADMFYVGHQGRFDAYVHSELKKLKQEYPQINYAVVLPICLASKMSMTITQIPCSPRESSLCILIMQFRGEIIGCSSRQIMLLPI